ncbi:MAG: hypothetical protein M1839_000756 [Geoglossum umbratile]|nr:MAG: hypothetical protein M1839_000756 [Geoglossum umbratile]
MSTYATTPPASLSTPPPAAKHALLSFPTPQIVLVTLNRPEALNCINMAGHWELHDIWEWLDSEPSLRAAIITGKGRAFCAGQDLKEWHAVAQGRTHARRAPPTGFAGLSRRPRFAKPVIAAVNGMCMGGGMELVANVPLVLATPGASFALPEVRRGVVPFAGALPRLARTIGRQRATEIAVTGRAVGAAEARDWGFVNRVVDKGLLEEAVALAAEVCKGSPEAVGLSVRGIEMGWEGGGVEQESNGIVDLFAAEVFGGENYKEGLRAFVEKREPRWVVKSKL